MKPKTTIKKTAPSQPSASALLEQPYTRVVKRDESGAFVATISEFPGCVTDGATAQEAMSRLERVAESWIDATRAIGQSIPKPFEEPEYSGKFALRLPRSMHKASVQRAAIEGTSVNQFFLAAIATYLGEVSGAAKARVVLHHGLAGSYSAYARQMLDAIAEHAVTGNTVSTAMAFSTSAGGLVVENKRVGDVWRDRPVVIAASTGTSSSSAELSANRVH